MYFCQKSEEFKENYLNKLKERLARDGYSKNEIDEIIECGLKDEKMSNIPSLEAIENGYDLW